MNRFETDDTNPKVEHLLHNNAPWVTIYHHDRGYYCIALNRSLVHHRHDARRPTSATNRADARRKARLLLEWAINQKTGRLS